MKKYYILFIILSGLLVWGCSSSPSTLTTPSGKLKVLSTTAMIDDLVGQIGRERIEHSALITGEMDPHSYELVKGDDEKLSMATIIFFNGLGLEHGASLRYQIEHHPQTVGVGNAILEKHPEAIIRTGKEIDPHIWMDISLWSETIEPITSALSQADPEGKEFYQENAARLREQMLQAHAEIYRDMQSVPQEKRYLVTSHDAFHYYTRAYLSVAGEEWQKRCDAPEGLAPEGQLSATDIQKVIGHLVEYRIPAVFPESNVSRDSLKKILHACAQKGVVVKIADHALYADAMGPKGSDAETYLGMIRHDANVMIEAWK
jgi:manganese/zinc/iron transport system substrate-binding protein